MSQTPFFLKSSEAELTLAENLGKRSSPYMDTIFEESEPHKRFRTSSPNPKQSNTNAPSVFRRITDFFAPKFFLQNYSSHQDQENAFPPTPSQEIADAADRSMEIPARKEIYSVPRHISPSPDESLNELSHILNATNLMDHSEEDSFVQAFQNSSGTS